MFVKAIVGRKGSGKTPIMLDQVESLANDKDSNIVFIEYGKTVDRILPIPLDSLISLNIPSADMDSSSLFSPA